MHDPDAPTPPAEAPQEGRSRRDTVPPGRRRPLHLLFACATAKEYAAAFGPLGAPAAPPAGQAVAWKRADRDCLLLVTGVGPVAAALSVGRVLGRFEGTVVGVVNCGIAGGFDLAATPLGACVAAVSEALPEYGIRTGAGTDAAQLAFPQLCPGGQAVFDRLPLDPAAAAAAMGLALPPQTRCEAAVTVAGVSGDPDRAAILCRKYRAATESMEGFAVALAAAAEGLPFLELRAVSNQVGRRPPEAWDLPGAFAALGRAVAGLFPKRG